MIHVVLDKATVDVPWDVFYTHPFVNGMRYCVFETLGLYIHIGVDSNVVCSTT